MSVWIRSDVTVCDLCVSCEGWSVLLCSCSPRVTRCRVCVVGGVGWRVVTVLCCGRLLMLFLSG